MNPLYYLLIIPIILIGLFIQNIRQKHRVRRFLKQSFGQAPKKTYTDKLPSVKKYYEACAKRMEQYREIDDITWNDLEMDLYFQSINTTYSSVGSETLYARLHRLEVPDVESVVTAIANEEKLRLDLGYYLYGMGKHDDNQVSDLLFEPEKQKTVGYHPIQTILPLIGIGLIFVYFPAGIFLTAIALVLNYYTRLRQHLVVDHGVEAIRYIAKAILFSRKIVSLTRAKLPAYSEKLYSALAPLNAIPSRGVPVQALEDPSNPFNFLIGFLNYFFLLDFGLYNHALSILTKHPLALLKLWETIGELEAAFVVASLDKRLQLAKPTFHEKMGITAIVLVHPLIADAIPNDVDFNQSMLISGSNASGKSTYVKAIAISAITAQNLNRVYGKEWQMKRGRVISSMAIRDNLYQGDSYFVAEIKSLKRMIEAAGEGRPVYLFIDEILKGTNTIERIAASNALLSHLQDQGALVIAATHDIELTELQADRMKNVHFRERVSEEEIVFDYLLKDGPTQTTNAINLLRYYDFPDSVTDQATQQADKFKQTRSWH